MNQESTTARAPLRVLIVEDSESDTILIVYALRRGPWTVTHERVDTAAAMSAALESGGWNLIIADYSLPQFSGPAALALAMDWGSDLPFILISGAVGEETAVQSMKAGADDYISKGNLARLVPAIERELLKAEGRREVRRSERRLRASEGRYRTLFEYAPDGIVIADAGSCSIDVNPSMCRMLGYAPDELIGLQASDIVTEAEFPHIGQALASLNTAGDGSREWRFKRKDGSVFAAEVIATMMPDGNLMGMVRDITHRKLVEAEVKRGHIQMSDQNQKLLALTQQAHRFVDDVSHEFRTPLAVIKEFSSIIGDGLAGPITPEQEQYVGIIDNAVFDLNQMVEDFLDSSKLRAGRLRIDRRPQKIDDLFARIRPGLQIKATSRSIELVERIEPDLPHVFADEEKVRRVIMNLATNAVKFSPERSKIELWARQAHDGGVEVGITDQGRGLAPSDLKQLFERFAQLPSAGAPSLKGFGLGLNIARHLVWLNLGTMNVASEPGKGSTFSFTLPTADPRMILKRFFLRLAECEEPASSVAVIWIRPDGPAESADALRLFLAATTRPTDVILDLPDPAKNGLLAIGPTGSAAGWASRLIQTRDGAAAETGPTAPESIRIDILGEFAYPAGATQAAACALACVVQQSALV